VDVTIDEKTKKMTIVIDISEKLSTSGKNMVIASTHGNVQTSATYKSKNVTLGVNAYYKP
jgi:ribosomal silencing factor RsfS